MRDVDTATEHEWQGSSLETPFAETNLTSLGNGAAAKPALSLLDEGPSPFAEIPVGEQPQSEMERQIAEAFAELRDEAFDEAVAYLAEETERDVSDRFAGENGSYLAERERFADARLQEVRYETERYLDTLAETLEGLELSSFDEQQLDEVLERNEPQPGEVTPAGEEFIRTLARKAKAAVKHVVNTAKKIGSVVNPLIRPLLGKLKGLVRPLLKRVLSFAVGRLPAPLRPAARKLAAGLLKEAEEEAEELGEGGSTLR